MMELHDGCKSDIAAMVIGARKSHLEDRDIRGVEAKKTRTHA